jgi:hypothetical protein
MLMFLCSILKLRFSHIVAKYLKISSLEHPMKLAGLVTNIKDCTKMLCFEFKNHRCHYTAALKKTSKKFEYLSRIVNKRTKK